MIAEITTERNSPKTMDRHHGGIVIQLILECNSKTTVIVYKETKLKYNNIFHCMVSSG